MATVKCPYGLRKVQGSFELPDVLSKLGGAFHLHPLGLESGDNDCAELLVQLVDRRASQAGQVGDGPVLSGGAQLLQGSADSLLH